MDVEEEGTGAPGIVTPDLETILDADDVVRDVASRPGDFDIVPTTSNSSRPWGSCPLPWIIGEWMTGR
jgi:hypothetical protein